MSTLRERRIALGLNQRELAERLHVPQSMLSDVELGKRKPWPRLARGLGRLLKVPLEDILADSGPKAAG